MSLLDDINLLLRDHTGYTGDGQGGRGDLPVGDRSTARWTPNMRAFRELLKAMAQAQGDPGALQDILDQMAEKAPLAATPRMFASVDAAVSAGQENLPDTVGHVLIRDGDWIEVRGPGQRQDELFATYPWWGLLFRVPSQALLQAERSERIAAIRDAGVLPLVNVSGLNDITASLVPSLIAGGVTLSGASSVELIPTATNTGAVTLDLGDGAVPVMAENGATLKAGELVVGRSYILRRRGNVWRIASGGVALVDMAAEISARAASDTALALALRAGAPLPTNVLPETPGMEGQRINLEFTSEVVNAGITNWPIGGLIRITPSASNSVTSPSVRLSAPAGDVTVTIATSDGAAWPVGGFVPGREFTLLRTASSFARVVSGEVVRGDLEAERAATVANFASAGLVRLTNVSGTADAITAEVPSGAADLNAADTGSYVWLMPTATNTIAGPTLTVGSRTRTMYPASGAAGLPAGHLVPGTWHLVWFSGNTVARVVGRMAASGEIESLRTGIDSVTADVSTLKTGSADVEFLSSELISRATRQEGQTADMSGLTATPGSGSKTMVLITSTSHRYPSGGVIRDFEVYLTAPGRYSVSSWLEENPGSIVPLAPHDVRYFEGVEGWNRINPGVVVPPGGSVGFGVTNTGTVGTNSALPALALRATSATENEPFTSGVYNFRYMVRFGVDERIGLNLPAAGTIDRALIDKTFDTPDGWTLTGASVVGGAMECGENATWLPRARPTDYPYSQLSRRTLSVLAEVLSADQIWGISSIRQNNGYELLAPAAIVDGTDGRLKIYRYDALSGSAPAAVAAEVTIPWNLTGSAVRLDLARDRFAFRATLTNLTTGQAVNLALDYVDGTASNALTGRPWGVPCILFPATTAGGVRVKRARMVADMPYPAGTAAKVILIGDSITEGSQMGPDFDQCWSYRLADERTARGAQDTVVAARGGQESGGALAAVDEAVRLCDSNTVVVVLIGTNDAERGGGSHAAWRANVSAMLTKIRTKTSRIALGCLPPGSTSGDAKRAAMNADILGGYFGELLPPVRFDLALSTNNDGVTWNTAYRLDSVHPNVAGNGVMLERLRIDCPEAFE